MEPASSRAIAVQPATSPEWVRDAVIAGGGHIVTDDLVWALKNNVIGGAALDVTDPEPLPESHSLWFEDTY